MTPDDAIEEARRGELRPVYVIVGEENHLIDRVVRALRDATLVDAIPGLNEDQLTAGEATVETLLSIARTIPMMSSRRWVLVRQVDKWEGDKKAPFERLVDYAKKPHDGAVVVLLGPKLDKRRKLVATARKEGFLVNCEALKRQELPRFIVQTARASGHSISISVADLIAEMAGPELGSITDALERVCLYVGKGNEVTEAAVSECVTRLRSASVWELVGAVGRRDVPLALTALDDVFDPQDRGLRLVGVLAWATRQLLAFESARRQGASPQDAAKAAGAPPFKAGELASQVRDIPRPVLETWLERLSDVDLALKGGSKRPAKAILEQAILDLCRVA